MRTDLLAKQILEGLKSLDKDTDKTNLIENYLNMAIRDVYKPSGLSELLYSRRRGLTLNLFGSLFRVKPVIDYTVRDLCKRPYPLHPKGCPNFGSRSTCPPESPFFDEAFKVWDPVYAIVNEFDLGAHIQKMRVRNPNWTERQLRCVLYWQNTARKELREKTNWILTVELKGYDVTYCPEAMGVNVTETLKNIGIILEWPPEKIVRQVAFMGKPNYAFRFSAVGI